MLDGGGLGSLGASHQPLERQDPPGDPAVGGALAVRSPVWVGWAALDPLAARLIWVRLNPRAFLPPRTTECWAEEATVGERTLLNRAVEAIPAPQRFAAKLLGVILGLGLVPRA